MYRLFYSFAPRSAVQAQETGFHFQVVASYANIFERALSEEVYQVLDKEQAELRLDVAYLLNEHFEIGLDVSAMYQSGGFLDPYITDYHDLFGLPNDTRDEVPDNDFRLFFQRFGEEPLLDESQVGTRIADPSLYLRRYLVLEPGRRYLALQLSYKSDWGEKGTAGLSSGWSVSASYARLNERWSFHGELLFAMWSVPDAWDPFTRDRMIAGSLYADRAFSWGTVGVQLHGGTPIFYGTRSRNLDTFPLNFLVTYEPPGSRWQVYFSEDITAEGPAVDFVLGLVRRGL